MNQIPFRQLFSHLKQGSRVNTIHKGVTSVYADVKMVHCIDI